MDGKGGTAVCSERLAKVDEAVKVDVPADGARRRSSSRSSATTSTSAPDFPLPEPGRRTGAARPRPRRAARAHPGGEALGEGSTRRGRQGRAWDGHTPAQMPSTLTPTRSATVQAVSRRQPCAGPADLRAGGLRGTLRSLASTAEARSIPRSRGRREGRGKERKRLAGVRDVFDLGNSGAGSRRSCGRRTKLARTPAERAFLARLVVAVPDLDIGPGGEEDGEPPWLCVSADRVTGGRVPRPVAAHRPRHPDPWHSRRFVYVGRPRRSAHLVRARAVQPVPRARSELYRFRREVDQCPLHPRVMAMVVDLIRHLWARWPSTCSAHADYACMGRVSALTKSSSWRVVQHS